MKFIGSVPFEFVVKIIADSVSLDISYFDNGQQLTKKQEDTFFRAFHRNLSGDYLPRYYLIMEYLGSFKPFYLDFQRVFVLPIRQVIGEYLPNRAASIVSPWREQIVAQYAGYSMKVGTPDYPAEDLKTLMSYTRLNFLP